MKIEVVEMEGFASVKKVDASENDVFYTPAPVYVPFLEDVCLDGITSGDVKKVVGTFPMMNISSMNEMSHDMMIEGAEGIGAKVLLTEVGPQAENKCVPPIPFKPLIFHRPDTANLLAKDCGSTQSFFFKYGLPDINSSLLISIPNLASILNSPGKMVKFVEEFRQIYGPEDLLYAAGVASPNNIPLLTYLGFDLFDTVKAARDATLLRYWGESGIFSLDEVDGGYLGSCSCKGCAYLSRELDNVRVSGNPAVKSVHKIVKALYVHNVLKLKKVIWECSRAIAKRKLHFIAQLTSAREVGTATIFNNFNRKFRAELVKRSPRSFSRQLPVTNSELLDHPDILLFCQRIKETYVPPRRDILLLLPCSYRKPYSQSKTHAPINKVIWTHSLKSNIHPVVVTSPLGIVPRELEYVYPAKNYDIPVTGVWSAREQERVGLLLRDIIAKGTYRHVISLLGDENYLVEDILHEYFTSPHILVHGVRGPSWSQAVSDLSTCLNDIASLGSVDVVSSHGSLGKWEKDDMWGVLSYQFDEGFAKKMLKGTRKTGRPPVFSAKDMTTGEQICRFVPRRGFFSLSKGAIPRWDGIEMNRVFIENFRPKGTIFCVGIVGADPGIHPGDEVAVFHDKTIMAIGRALTDSQSMVCQTRGPGVKVRHNPSKR